MMNSTPMIAAGRPIGLIVHMPIVGMFGLVFCAWIIRPCTTRFVLVPISVHVPPSTAA